MGLNTIWAGKFVRKRKNVLFTALDKGVGSADLAIREINIQIQIRIEKAFYLPCMLIWNVRLIVF